MPKTNDEVPEKTKKRTRRAPALTEEAREKQMIALCMDEAERRIKNGTASNTLICHFLKLGSSREKLEQEKLKNETTLTTAKTESLAEEKNLTSLYVDAINAFKSYSGQTTEDEEDEDL